MKETMMYQMQSGVLVSRLLEAGVIVIISAETWLVTWERAQSFPTFQC